MDPIQNSVASAAARITAANVVEFKASRRLGSVCGFMRKKCARFFISRGIVVLSDDGSNRRVVLDDAC